MRQVTQPSRGESAGVPARLLLRAPLAVKVTLRLFVAIKMTERSASSLVDKQ